MQTSCFSLFSVVFAMGFSIAMGCQAQEEARPAADLHLFFDAPATNWEREALPIGNGRLGAMVFGGVEAARFQFNVDSLWTGDENPSGLYNEAGSGMGAYQNFGELVIELNGGVAAAEAEISCASGHRPHVEREGVASSVDGDDASKWCVEPGDAEIVWQVDLGEAKEVGQYSFTSANDVPARDPAAWVVSGSAEGEIWTTIDPRSDVSPHAGRHEARSYDIEEPGEYRYYRMTFTPNPGVSHFQLAEIALDGIELGVENEEEKPRAYRRTLDIRTAIHTTTWVGADGTRYTRESFVSHPHEVLAIRMTADGPSKLSGRVRLEGAHGETAEAPEGPRFGGDFGRTQVSISGQLPNDLAYHAIATVACDQIVDTDGNSVGFSHCSEVIVFLVADTDYAMDRESGWRRAGLGHSLQMRLNDTELMTWEIMRSAHVADHQALFDRVELNIESPDAALADRPINERIASHPTDHDPALDALLFQYGRYLLISSSRMNGLPANLQGLWNNSNNPPWHADYHSNINMQMCYWLAEPANLGECHEPMFALLDATIPVAVEATRAAFGEEVPGFTFRTSHNIFGGQGWQWNIPASAWYSLHYWEHYAFTGDEVFLREQAWPFFEGVCAYWLHELKELPNGELVAPNGWSPEHGPHEDGIAHDQQLIWELYSNTIKAAQVLGIENEFVERITDARDRLHGPEIGRWGQLMEWMVDRDDPNDHHRHTSQLIAVFPGQQISVTRTPELAEAAAVSLRARGSVGDSRRSWTWAWRSAMWARLREPADSQRMIDGLLQYNMLPNLFTTHPPFQIDGNLGITAGMCEMLLQSHAGEIDLLPAVDFERWRTGSFAGLRARGGYTVSVQWEQGRVISAQIHADQAGRITVRCGESLRRVVDGDGVRVQHRRGRAGAFYFEAEQGQTYRLSY